MAGRRKQPAAAELRGWLVDHLIALLAATAATDPETAAVVNDLLALETSEGPAGQLAAERVIPVVAEAAHLLPALRQTDRVKSENTLSAAAPGRPGPADPVGPDRPPAEVVRGPGASPTAAPATVYAYQRVPAGYTKRLGLQRGWVHEYAPAAVSTARSRGPGPSRRAATERRTGRERGAGGPRPGGGRAARTAQALRSTVRRRDVAIRPPHNGHSRGAPRRRCVSGRSTPLRSLHRTGPLRRGCERRAVRGPGPRVRRERLITAARPELAAVPVFSRRFQAEARTAERLAGGWAAPPWTPAMRPRRPRTRRETPLWTAAGYVPSAAAGRGDLDRRSAARACPADTGRGHRRDPLPGARRRVRAPGPGPRRRYCWPPTAPASPPSAAGRGGLGGGSAAGQLSVRLGYLTPEQIEGKEVSAASDLFVLGLLLAYAATGTTRSRRGRPRRPPAGSPRTSPNSTPYRRSCAS